MHTLFGVLKAAMAVKVEPEAAEFLDKTSLQAAMTVLDKWSLDDAKAFAQSEHGGALTAVLDHLATPWKPRKRAGESEFVGTYLTAKSLVKRWMPEAEHDAAPGELVAMLKDAVEAPPALRGRHAGVKAFEAITKGRGAMSPTVGRLAMMALSINIARVLSDFSLDDAKRFMLSPHGRDLSVTFDSMLTTPQLKQMGKRWGLKMGKTESHTMFAQRLREVLDAPSESTPEPAPTRRRGRRAEAAPEPTPEPAPKKGRGGGGGRKAADHAWQPVDGKPGRRKRKLPSGKWHYEDVPLQKAGERRGAYLVRVLRWHLEQMKEFR